MQKLFARLSQHNFFAQPVQKTTAGFPFQRLHRVADARLCQVQLPRRLGETARARQHGERANLTTVEWSFHE